MKVCEKVRNKGFTSYNEVADELVLEFAAGMHGSADSQVCQSNVYYIYNIFYLNYPLLIEYLRKAKYRDNPLLV